jgi:hypothetical protein
MLSEMRDDDINECLSANEEKNAKEGRRQNVGVVRVEQAQGARVHDDLLFGSGASLTFDCSGQVPLRSFPIQL